MHILLLLVIVLLGLASSLPFETISDRQSLDSDPIKDSISSERGQSMDSLTGIGALSTKQNDTGRLIKSVNTKTEEDVKKSKDDIQVKKFSDDDNFEFDGIDFTDTNIS